MSLPLDQQSTTALIERRCAVVKQIDDGRFQLAHRVVGRERTLAQADVVAGRVERGAIDAILATREDSSVESSSQPSSPEGSSAGGDRKRGGRRGRKKDD